jgi:hypothetical protein
MASIDDLTGSFGARVSGSGVPDFSGLWFTTFGPMELAQQGDRVHGSYTMQQSRCTIEGGIRENRFHFEYREPAVEGEGWFDLERHGRFAGQWRPNGSSQWSPWRGERGFEGIWQTSSGLLRLVQEPDRVRGFYEGAGPCSLEGRWERNRLEFRYREPRSQGEGRFALAPDAASFEGEWRAEGGQQSAPWLGRRLAALPGVVWLVVIEAHWQRSFLDREYAFGHMLREFFSRLPHINTRQRFFEDEAGLERWCRELMYIPEPVAVIIASHGTADGLTVHGRPFSTATLAESFRYADNVLLLHFSCCMMMQDGKAGELARALQRFGRFPVSGYDRSVDWAASALIEFHYLDMVLARGLPPAEAARNVLRLIAYSGDNHISDSPYPAAGFRILPPAAK